MILQTPQPIHTQIFKPRSSALNEERALVILTLKTGIDSDPVLILGVVVSKVLLSRIRTLVCPPCNPHVHSIAAYWFIILSDVA